MIGQKNFFAKSPVLHRCSWLASRLGTEKKCTAILLYFYRNLPPQFYLACKGGGDVLLFERSGRGKKHVVDCLGHCGLGIEV